MLLNCSAGKDSWESLGQQDQTSQSSGKSTLNTHWMDWCWSKNSSILVIWGEQLTHWKSPWFWERLRAEEEGIREWDGWMASPMQEFGQTLGDGEGQGGLACCSLWGHKESDTTGQLNNNNCFGSTWLEGTNFYIFQDRLDYDIETPKYQWLTKPNLFFFHAIYCLLWVG